MAFCGVSTGFLVTIFLQLIFQVQCTDHRYGIPKKLPRVHGVPGSFPHRHPNHPLANPYINNPDPYNPYVQSPFGMNPNRMPVDPHTFQPPYSPPYSSMPGMQPPRSPFSQYSSPYTSAEDMPEDLTSDYSMPVSQTNYMTPSLQPNYMAPSSPPSYMTHSSHPSYMSLDPQSSYVAPSYQPSYTTPNTQSNYMIPNSQADYSNPLPSSYLPTSQPGYFVPPPNYWPTSQTSYTAPASHLSIPPNPQPNYAVSYPNSQTHLPPGYPTNPYLNASIPPQPQVLPVSMVPSNISFVQNSTIDTVQGLAAATDDGKPMTNFTIPSPPIPVNQIPNNLAPNPYSSNPSETAELATDQTSPIISSNGETSTDLNSLPPQVKEFIDMIPNILAMPESSALAPADQMQSTPFEGRPRQPPFSLRKHPKGLPLHKRKSYYPPSSLLPSVPAPPFSPSGYYPMPPVPAPVSYK